ncbi:MAG: hypothetical protein KTR30_33305 [Saprospiraceae bacterium]|nr:hypothetical protein [Saprospiraceae bacterium]
MFLDFELFASPDKQLQPSDLSGKGSRGIFIAYEADTAEKERLDYLKKILAAAKIDLDQDVNALALDAETSIQLNRSAFATAPQYILLFGVKPKQLSLNFQLPTYSPVSYQGTTYLCVDSLATIQEERMAGKNQKAGALWLALKQIFLPSA